MGSERRNAPHCGALTWVRLATFDGESTFSYGLNPELRLSKCVDSQSVCTVKVVDAPRPVTSMALTVCGPGVAEAGTRNGAANNPVALDVVDATALPSNMMVIESSLG